MLQNRSIPPATVIPELAYADVDRAAAWLCDAFGFSIRLRIASHRIQMNVGERVGGVRAAVIVREYRPGESGAGFGLGCSTMVRVEDVDAHAERARRHGARVIKEPQTYPYGERQYNVRDFAGYSWTFTQSVADADPAAWGGELVEG